MCGSVHENVWKREITRSLQCTLTYSTFIYILILICYSCVFVFVCVCVCAPLLCVCLCVRVLDNLFKPRERSISGREMQLRSRRWVLQTMSLRLSTLPLCCFFCFLFFFLFSQHNPSTLVCHIGRECRSARQTRCTIQTPTYSMDTIDVWCPNVLTGDTSYPLYTLSLFFFLFFFLRPYLERHTWSDDGCPL